MDRCERKQNLPDGDAGRITKVPAERYLHVTELARAGQVCILFRKCLGDHSSCACYPRELLQSAHRAHR